MLTTSASRDRAANILESFVKMTKSMDKSNEREIPNIFDECRVLILIIWFWNPHTFFTFVIS